MVKTELRVGAQLNNGSTLLAWKEERDTVVVLALNPTKGEYVTWLMNENGDCVAGNYHQSLLYAVDDYKARS